MAATNRAVTFLGPYELEVQDREYPTLKDPKGRKIEHAVILKIITTNSCGSDLHIYHGRFAAPPKMQLGHENTGEVIEVGSHVERVKVGDIVSVPFNVACGLGQIAVLHCRSVPGHALQSRSDDRHSVGPVALPRWTPEHRNHTDRESRGSVRFPQRIGQEIRHRSA